MRTATHLLQVLKRVAESTQTLQAGVLQRVFKTKIAQPVFGGLGWIRLAILSVGLGLGFMKLDPCLKLWRFW